MSTMVEPVSALLNFPETIEKIMHSLTHPNGTNLHDRRGDVSVTLSTDILDTAKEYVFFMDVPGFSKSDIQVTIEDENILVIKSSGKRKREEEGCKYVRLERRPPKKLVRKFRLPENCNLSATTAKCENGVLTVVVEKLPPPPPPKSKTVEVTIS